MPLSNYCENIVPLIDHLNQDLTPASRETVGEKASKRINYHDGQSLYRF